MLPSDYPAEFDIPFTQGTEEEVPAADSSAAENSSIQADTSGADQGDDPTDSPSTNPGTVDPSDDSPRLELGDGDFAEETPKETQPQRTFGTPETDAQNIFAKWDTFSDEQKAEKIQKISSRPQTMEALAQKLDTDVDTLQSEFGQKPVEPVDIANHPVVQQLQQQLAELQGKISGNALTQFQDFQKSLDTWGEETGLDKESIKNLKKVDGEFFASLQDYQYDPKSGRPLSMQGKIKMAAYDNPKVFAKITGQKAKAQADQIMAGQKAALPGQSGDSAQANSQSWANTNNPHEILRRQDEAAGGASLPWLS